MENTNSSAIKPTSELGYATDPEPTKQTWDEYLADNATPYRYVDATYDMLKKIEKVAAINDFSKMKEALTRIYTERYEFVAHAIRHPE